MHESMQRLLAQFSGTPRYRLVRLLGHGAFGVVFEAHDIEQDSRVALKVLYREQVGALRRFKNEFRAIADISHPNLVMLFDLATHEDTWFLTMELINGRSFLDYVWRVPPTTTAASRSDTLSVTDAPVHAASVKRGDPSTLDRARLRTALAQLVRGIAALHRAHRLHRDLKPSNVLIEEETGRLSILDFGMVGDLSERAVALTGIVGTPGYIAPELARGEPATEAADWYAVGATLYEALTGRLPPRTMRDSNGRGSFIEETARDDDGIQALCRRLLSDDPNARPTAAELLAWTAGLDQKSRNESFHEAANRAPLFVGRADEQKILRAALHEARGVRQRGVLLTGASGVGKSALMRHFFDEIRIDADVVVLSGRCYERESVPYKALDELIDSLAQYLQSLSDAERHPLFPPHIRVLARLFPSLRPIAETAARDAEVLDPPDPRELRQLAFGALKVLLARLASKRAVVLFIDDMQWGDPDSVALLEELVRPPDSPALLFVVSHREALDSSWPLLTLLERALKMANADWRRIALSTLGPEDTRELANAMLPAGSDRALQVETLVRESQGSPFFLQRLAKRVISQGAGWESAAVALPIVIREQVAALPDASSHLVEVLSVAGRPLSQELALAVVGIDRGAGQASILHAVNTHLLLTRRTSAGVLLEPSHDKVRESVMSGLAPDRARSWHKRLAETLREMPSPDPEVLVEHYVGAGENVEAGHFALHAAKHANEVLAFDRAASHLALALETTIAGAARRAELLSMRAEALANAGRGGEAADCFRDSAALLSTQPSSPSAPQDILALKRRAGEHYLRSGRIDDGMAAMNVVLREIGIGLPSSRARALASMALKRMFLLLRGIDFEPRDRASIHPAKTARLDALWGATTSISMLNFVVADPLGVQHLLESLEAGDPSHVIRGLGYEAAFEAVLGGRFFNARCRSLLDRMDEMADESDVPYDRAWARMARGITSWSLGDFATVVRVCDEAERIYRERCRGVAWELAVTDAFGLQSLASLGRIAELSRRVPQRLRLAEERGDLFAANILRLGHPNMIHLAAGDVERAREEAKRGFAPIPKETYITPHYHFLLASCQRDLYQGNGPEAFDRVERDWPRVKSAQFLRAQCLRLEIRHLRARCALAAAESEAGSGVARRRLLAYALNEANRIRRDELPLGRALSDAVVAGVLVGRGDQGAALTTLGQCVEQFDSLGLCLYREAARYCHGVLIGGDEGRGEVLASTRWMESEAIADPKAMVRMVMPGLPTN